MKIASLLQKQQKPFYSFEFFPPKDQAQWPAFFEVSKKLAELKPLFVSVTYGAGGGSQDNTLEISRRLRQDCGFVPMPHLTCVGADQKKIGNYLKELDKFGIDNVLALRGDAPVLSGQAAAYDWTQGEFHYAADLVKFIAKEFTDFGVGVAAYPAPHPESKSYTDDRAYTALKLDAGADFAVTQLFFDARDYIDLVSRLRQLGNYSPVIPGILPIQSFESLKHVLSLCGANIPARLYLALEAANLKGGAEAVREAGISFAVEQIKQLLAAGAPGIHLYTLNKSDLCLRILEQAGILEN